MGDDTQYWEEPWRIPSQGGPPPVRNSTKVRHGGVVVIPASEHSNGVGGTRGGEDICTPHP